MSAGDTFLQRIRNDPTARHNLAVILLAYAQAKKARQEQ